MGRGKFFVRWIGISAICCLLVTTNGCLTPRPNSPLPAGSPSPNVWGSSTFASPDEAASYSTLVQLASGEGEQIARIPLADGQLNAQEPEAAPEFRPPTDTSRHDTDALTDSIPRASLDRHSPQSARSHLTLDEVLRSVYESYPLLRVANEQHRIADGELLAAQGAFDTKLKGGGTTGPLGFYETYRFGAGVEQALFGGGEVFAGYRIGRGNFQPWYGERQTNDGGEFKAGFLIPLMQNRAIDPRRAEVFRAALGRDAIEPDVLLQLIGFVRSASYAYFEWVAAGQEAEIAQSLLEIAQQRQGNLQKRVERGDLPRIELTDNQRLVISRHAALIDAQRKFEQSAIKLSLFLRTLDGETIIVPSTRLPQVFPETGRYDDTQLDIDIQSALTSRPELQYLDYVRRQLDIDLAQARNLYKPEMDVGLVGSQDMGAAASSKRDKSPFELEASLALTMPVQRRKAIGKIRAIQGKLAQVTSKQQFAGDKVSTEVRNAVAALRAAFQRIDQARESVELNIAMEQAERRRFAQGDSNLLVVNLREQATADARKTLVAVLLQYFQATADYHAAMATVPTIEL